MIYSKQKIPQLMTEIYNLPLLSKHLWAKQKVNKKKTQKECTSESTYHSILKLNTICMYFVFM